jgi:hypothetical protein
MLSDIVHLFFPPLHKFYVITPTQSPATPMVLDAVYLLWCLVEGLTVTVPINTTVHQLKEMIKLRNQVTLADFDAPLLDLQKVSTFDTPA